MTTLACLACCVEWDAESGCWTCWICGSAGEEKPTMTLNEAYERAAAQLAGMAAR